MPARADEAAGAPSLRRAVGTVAATATSAGLAFAAIDYLGVVSVATYAAGASAWLALLVAGLLALLVAGVFAELNALYPSAAGIRLYLGRALGERAALGITFTYLTTVVLVIAADAFIIGAAIQHVLGEPPSLAYVWILGLLGAATAANLLGVRLTTGLQTVVTYTVLASTAALSVVAILRGGNGFPHLLGLFHHGPVDALQAVAFGVFVFAAFEWVTTTAEEARRPAVVNRALLLAPLLLFVACGLFSLGLTHLVDLRAERRSPYPQLLLGARALGTAGELWALAATLLTAVNTFNGGFLVASRFLYAAAREGSLPRPFARLNLRAVPWLAVATLAAAAAVTAAVVFATHAWLLLVSVGAALEAGIYALASWCVLALRRKVDRPRPFRLPLAGALAGGGVAVFALLALATAFSDPSDPRRLSIAPAAVIASVGLLAVAYVRLAVPRLRAAAERRAAAARPRRRPGARA